MPDIRKPEHIGDQSQEEEGEDSIKDAIDKRFPDHHLRHLSEGEINGCSGQTDDRAAVPFVTAHHADDHKEGLEHDNDKDGRYQVSAVTFGRIVEGCTHDVDRLSCRQFRG